eukprot:TRINITY_DN16852_c0_g1_i1.p1 TRINITY_DN16852_c0_g1~~TRINITY_DN16852_c0_g1_i1.p1  ORF type:complete len:79 (+),score=12.46 TRINITY_DN16852_c0_g1_i1:328-564(+)
MKCVWVNCADCHFLYHLYRFNRIRGPFLIVAPLSTIGHWKREIEEWTDLNVVVYYDQYKGKETRGEIRKYEFTFWRSK